MNTARPPLTVLLAAPRGFCAGVARAVATVEQALARFGAPVYVRRQIVHNQFVVEQLAAKGAVFVADLGDVPANGIVVFSAHGVSQAVRREAGRRRLTVIDATCPLVTKVHREAIRHEIAGRHVILIGHDGHPEVIGTLGQVPTHAITLVQSAAEAARISPPPGRQLAYVTQTTLAVDEAAAIVAVLRRRFPGIAGPRSDDICYATTNRQQAVKALAPHADAMLVVGAPNSSNSVRLLEVAGNAGCPRTQLIGRAAEIDWSALRGIRRLGITAGASAPEILVDEVLQACRSRYDVTIETFSVIEEDVHFRLPRVLSA
ncbi:MAG TPA: 4-hydroxy-3-methylbut-2-enyl diphosphate reductase [Dongiaceae bacterium]